VTVDFSLQKKLTSPIVSFPPQPRVKVALKP